MSMVNQIIFSALLFCSLSFVLVARAAFRDVRIAWYLVLAVSLSVGKVPRPKFNGRTLAGAAFMRTLAATLYGYCSWHFGKMLIVLVPLTWKILVAL